MSGATQPPTTPLTEQDVDAAIAELERQGIVERVGPDQYQLTELGRQRRDAAAKAVR